MSTQCSMSSNWSIELLVTHMQSKLNIISKMWHRVAYKGQNVLALTWIALNFLENQA